MDGPFPLAARFGPDYFSAAMPNDDHIPYLNVIGIRLVEVRDHIYAVQKWLAIIAIIGVAIAVKLWFF